ncbi:MAG: 50S ribosomal protein L11 methyltransferase [Rhizobiaceae bacterium]
MKQARIFFETDGDRALGIASSIENLFELEGYPVSASEIDEASGRWNVSVYVPADEAKSVSSRISGIIQEEDLATSLDQELLEDRDWVSETLRDLQPVRAGRYIVHGSHTPDAALPNEHSICIDAGQAFGTGHHGTTAGCLDMLQACLKRRNYLSGLDLGTGSGVLAIAMAKSAPMRVLATDIDPVAISVAKQNFRSNQTGGQIQAVTATGFSHRQFRNYGPFDLVVANILAGPLDSMATELCRYLDKRSTVILSGLLPHQRNRILARYRGQGLKHVHTHLRDGWIVLVLERM